MIHLNICWITSLHRILMFNLLLFSSPATTNCMCSYWNWPYSVLEWIRRRELGDFAQTWKREIQRTTESFFSRSPCTYPQVWCNTKKSRETREKTFSENVCIFQLKTHAIICVTPFQRRQVATKRRGPIRTTALCAANARCSSTSSIHSTEAATATVRLSVAYALALGKRMATRAT